MSLTAAEFSLRLADLPHPTDPGEHHLRPSSLRPARVSYGCHCALEPRPGRQVRELPSTLGGRRPDQVRRKASIHHRRRVLCRPVWFVCVSRLGGCHSSELTRSIASTSYTDREALRVRSDHRHSFPAQRESPRIPGGNARPRSRSPVRRDPR